MVLGAAFVTLLHALTIIYTPLQRASMFCQDTLEFHVLIGYFSSPRAWHIIGQSFFLCPSGNLQSLQHSAPILATVRNNANSHYSFNWSGDTETFSCLPLCNHIFIRKITDWILEYQGMALTNGLFHWERKNFVFLLMNSGHTVCSLCYCSRFGL